MNEDEKTWADLVGAFYPNQKTRIKKVSAYINNFIDSAIKGILPDPKNPVKGFAQNLELGLLKSPIGNYFINKIKSVLNNLSPTQLVLLANGKFNVKNAILNAFLHTNYETAIVKKPT